MRHLFLSRLLLLVFGFLAALRCAPAAWTHPTKTQADYERDRRDCEVEAAQVAANWGMAGNPFLIADEMKKCMRLKHGWTAMNQSEVQRAHAVAASVFVLDFKTTVTSGVRTSRRGTTKNEEYRLTANGSSAEDGELSFSIDAEPYEVSLSVENRTATPLRLLLDEISFVDLEGVAHRMIRNGVLPDDRERSQQPITVIGDSRAVLKLLSVDAISKIGDRWQMRVAVPREIATESGALRPLPAGLTQETLESNVAVRNRGKVFRLFVPVEVRGEIREYTFTLDTVDVSARQVTVEEFERLRFRF